MSDQQTFKVAVIGAGIGAAHIEGFAALPDLFEMATVCDLDEAKAKDAIKGLPNCKIVSDYKDVIADPDIDIIDICLPPHFHFPVMMEALAAGKHVICEKPLTTSLAEADQVVARSKETGKLVFPVFQYRYCKGYQKLKRLINADMTGKPYVASMETHWQRGADYYAVPWRGKWATEQGGSTVGHAIHIHNLMTHALGKVVKVAAFLDTKVNPIETEDCCAISMQMESGALVTSSITLGAAGGLSRMRICYEHVTVESASPQPFRIEAGEWVFTATDPSRQAEFDAITAPDESGARWFHAMWEDVHKVLTGNNDVQVPNLEDGRHSIEFITATYQAARDNVVVSLPLDASNRLYNGWAPEAK